MTNSNKTVKSIYASIWYIFGSVITKGIAFIATPILVRLLSVEQYAEYVNYLTWLSFITIFTSLELHSALNRAKFDFPDELDSYIFSNVLFSALFTLLLFIIVSLNKGFFVRVTGLDYFSLAVILLLACMLAPTLSFVQVKARLFYEYKAATALSIVYAAFSLGGAVLFAFVFDDKYVGVLIGKNLVPFLMYIALFAYIIVKGKKPSLRHVGYGLSISLLIIPHVFARIILQGSDKIMIEKMCAPIDLGMYSIAYTCGTLANFILMSINNAFLPWLFDSLHNNERKEIKLLYRLLFGLFSVCIVLILFASPEIVYILGGKTYANAVYATIPIMASCAFQFLYTMYSNVEYYYKKTGWISIGTIIAALCNIGLNLWLIPKYGYIAASYTTLASYAILCLTHVLIVRFILKEKALDDIVSAGILGCVLLATVIASMLVERVALRYIIIAAILAAVAAFAYKKRDLLRAYIKREKHD